ncbi:HD domain-containing phosphohydrolase [Kosmotoga pacifica]|uniref:HD domain-containing phosphohydrolase n=1 Tax=Kosmotoga pacifica TaxID=1330330 RepID=UPI00069A0CF7|nr:HD domain-containing phosphohydrolase [Kosmotoga pacifica]
MESSVVLVVSKNRVFGVFLKKLFESWGYSEIFFTPKAEKAIERVELYKPDITVIDIQSKDEKDLLELEALLRSRYDIPSVVLIPLELTSSILKESFNTPFGYVTKPLDENFLKISMTVALKLAEMQRNLRDDEEFLSTVLTSMKEGIVVFDDRGYIRLVNPEAERLLSKKKENLIGKNIVNTMNFESFEGDAVDFLSGQVPSECYLVVDKKLPVSINYSRVKGRNFRGWLFTFTDISEERKARQELEKSYRRLEQTLMETVRTISKITESRDSYTAAHQRHVAVIAMEIAKELGFSKDRLKWLYVAALLHDVGKVSVPSEILSKPTKLNIFEMELVKMHPETGYQILGDIPFPINIAEIVRQHHERLDGSGYPRGLKGDEILLEARILAVADVLEAITNHRPYRPALGLEVALDELKRNSGKLYDPQVVDACLKAIEKGKLVLDALEEKDYF